MAWGIIAAVVAVVTSAASYIAQRQAQRRAKEDAEDAAAVQISGHNSNRGLYVVYGRALVGSTTIWKKVTEHKAAINNPSSDWVLLSQSADPTDTGTNDDKRWLYRAVSLCQGPVEDIETVLIDGQSYLDDRFSTRTLNHFASNIYKGYTTGDHWDRLINKDASEFREWGSDKLGREVCYAIERLFLHKKSPAFQGEPDTQYLIKGRRLYDPRLDSTVAGGSGTHRYNDDTTWEWSANPALATLDYITSTVYGRGLSHADDIDLQSFQAAADACDVSVTIPSRLTNTTGGLVMVYSPIYGETYTVPNAAVWDHYRPDQVGTGQPRFSCNVALDPDKTVNENLKILLNTFRANMPYVNGRYSLVMEDVASSVMSLTDDDIIGGLQIQSGDRAQRTNRATVKFLNANKNYREDQVSWPGVNDAQYTTYLNEDQNEALHQQYTLHGVTDYYQAEDIAEFIVRDSRTTLSVRGKFHPRTMLLVPGDVIDLTYDSASWVTKYFKVSSINIDTQTLETQMELREYDSSVYTWNASRGNEPLGFSWTNPTFNAELTAPVIGTISSAAVTHSDGSRSVIVTVPYSGIPSEATIAELLWAESGTDDWQSVVIPDPDGTQSSVSFSVPRGDQAYDIRLRYRALDQSGAFMYSIEDTDTHTTATLGAPHVMGPNLILDPNFLLTAAEGGVGDAYAETYWDQTQGNNWSINLTGSEDSGPCIQLDGDGTGNNILATPYMIPLNVNDTLFLRVRAYRDATAVVSGTNFRIEIAEYDADGVLLSSYPDFIDANDLSVGWHTVTASVSPLNSNVRQVQVWLVGTASFTAGFLRFSHMEVSRVEPGATIGATLGDNLIDENGATVGDIDMLNRYVNGRNLAGELTGNPFMTRVDPDYDRPWGVRATYGNVDAASLRYADAERSVLENSSTLGDTSVGFCWPAFRVQSGMRYRAFLRWRMTSGTIAGGTASTYLRFLHKDGEIAQGKTHIGWSQAEGGASGDLDYGSAAPYNAGSGSCQYISDTNGGTGSWDGTAVTALNTWYETVVEWTPDAAARWASLCFLNWTGVGDATFEFDTVFIYPVSTYNTGTLADQDTVSFANGDIEADYIASSVSSNRIARLSTTRGTTSTSYVTLWTINVTGTGDVRFTADYQSYSAVPSSDLGGNIRVLQNGVTLYESGGIRTNGTWVTDGFDEVIALQPDPADPIYIQLRNRDGLGMYLRNVELYIDSLGGESIT